MKINSIYKYILAILSVLSFSHVFAYDFEQNGLCYTILSQSERTLSVTGYLSSDTDENQEGINIGGGTSRFDVKGRRGASSTESYTISIPSSVDCQDQQYNVVAIGDNAFWGKKNMGTIIVPASVVSIGATAFHDCLGLQKILCYASTPAKIQATTFDVDTYNTASLYLLNGGNDAYNLASYWKQFMVANPSDLVESISLNKESVDVMLDDTVQLIATTIPDFSNAVSLVWESFDTNVVTVDNTGLVTAIGAGNAEVTARSTSGQSATCKIIVSIPKYVVTFLVDGETYKTMEVEYKSSIIVPNNPQKEGYTFSGWSEIPGTMPHNDITITGSFAVNQYKVIFISDGNTIQETIQDYDSAITAPENPTKEGYTFTGWSPEVVESVPANDVTYEAQFSINSYNLTYVVDGEEYRTETLEYNSTISPLVVPGKEGYTFSGWSEIPTTMPASDVTVTASFTVNQYMVRFETEDGTLISEQMQDYGSAIVVPTAPVKEGYEFAGWNEDIAETVPAHDVTYVACYKLIVIYVAEIRLDHSSLSLPEGESTQLKALVLPTNATNQELEWTSSEESVATVENGLVTAIKEGVTIITAKATDGSNQMGQCIVIVTEGSGVTSIQNANEIVGYYTLDGKRLQKLQKGVNVIRMKNGTTKKVLIK